MNPHQALIEAAVRHLSNCRCGGTGLYSRNPYLVEPFDCDKCSELRAAISSAKAVEEGVEAKWRTPMIPEYLLNDARREYESLETGIKVTGWNPPGTWPELQNVPVECIVNIYQKGVIAQTVVTTGIYEDEKDGPDFHPNLPSADMWGGIDVVLWREVREKEGL